MALEVEEGPREKRAGFGLPSQPTPQVVKVFETPNYEVVVARLSTGPEDQPAELRIRYVVISKRHPVIMAHSGLEGEAITLALAAESAFEQARDMAAEATVRGYSKLASSLPTGRGAPNLA